MSKYKGSQAFIADGLIETLRGRIVTATDTLSQFEVDALRPALERLMRSTAFPKILDLWVPFGTSALTGALQKIIGHSTAGNSFTAIGSHVAGDYTPITGFTGNGSSKGLNTGFNPTAAGVSATSWGYGVYAMKAAPSAASGVLAGSVTGTNTFLTYTDNTSKMNNVTISAVPQYSRFSMLQANGSNVEQYNHGYLHGTAVLTGGSLVNANISLLTNNGGNWSSQTLSGWVAFSPALTAAEAKEIGLFFDCVNAGLGRTPFKTLGVLGDSNTRGLGLTTPATDCWGGKLAVKYGLTLVNAGVDNTTMSDNHDGGASGNWSVSRKITNTARLASTLYVVALGTNDDQYNVSFENFQADYDAWLNYQWQLGLLPSNFILCSPLNATNNASNTKRQLTFGMIIRKLARKYGCKFFDAFSYIGPATNTTLWQSDQLHMKDAGHTLYAQGLSEVISKSFT